MGTEDGLAMAPYIRESRRILALTTIREQDVSAEHLAEGSDRARQFTDSVGTGYYRIDLHPSTGGDNYIDVPSLPFQIPLGALIPVRTKNLLPAAKNIGTTHLTNGRYRLTRSNGTSAKPPVPWLRIACAISSRRNKCIVTSRYSIRFKPCSPAAESNSPGPPDSCSPRAIPMPT